MLKLYVKQNVSVGQFLSPALRDALQVDLDLLRCQQLKLYILKAGRALLSHQDQLRQILSQPAVQEAAAAHTGIFLRSSFGSARKAEIGNRQGT